MREVKTTYELLFLLDVKNHLESTLDIVKREIDKSQDLMKSQFGKKTSNRKLKVGDYCYYPPIATRCSCDGKDRVR